MKVAMKIFSFFAGVVMFTIVFPMTVSAAGASGLTKDSPTPNGTITSPRAGGLSDAEYAERLEKVRMRAEKAITPELKERVRIIQEKIDSTPALQALLGSQTRAAYTTTAESLEMMLCGHDGLGLFDIADIFFHALGAKADAAINYDDLGIDIEMKEDAYRHMTWNFLAIKDVGEYKTRVATINHEWADRILSAVTQYEFNRYSYYFLTIGLPENDAQSLARAEANAYAITYRDSLIGECKNSLDFFNDTFYENSYIMDFWNNKIGRDYGKSNPSASSYTVFEDAWDAGQLIKHEGSTSITDTIRADLHASNWWYF